MSETWDDIIAGEPDDARESQSGGTGFAGSGAGETHARRPEVSETLRTVVELVRRIMHTDTASIASFSVADETITWRAVNGFQTLADGNVEIVNSSRGEFAQRAADADESVIEVRGVAGDLPVSEFPLHSAEGVRALALAPLIVRGETLGVLAVGYRSTHRFTAEAKQQLEGLAGMAALALDNTRLFETLGAAKRIWEQTFDAIPDGIIVHDDRMRIARCNLWAAELMGMLPAEAIGMPCADAFARIFGERAAAYHMRPDGARSTTSSFELQAEDGRRYLVAVAPLTNLAAGGWARGSDVEDETTTGAQDVSKSEAAEDPTTRERDLQASWSVITWSDITQLAEVQEQLARTRRLATVGQLAAGVAHEINNPLAAITTCAEATLRDLRASPQTASLVEERNWNFYLEEIVRQALRCKEITRGLLDLSRQRRARRESCDINRLVEQCARLFDERGREAGVSFDMRLDAAVGEVATDEAMVRQILDNLLSNALDAVGAGGHVGVETSSDGPRIRIEIDDDGPGIPPEMLARIFDPFFTTKDPGRGSGLGLAISLTLAEALGGALTVESKHAAGSLFRLWLPRRTPEKH